jgi:hypothetical protein
VEVVGEVVELVPRVLLDLQALGGLMEQQDLLELLQTLEQLGLKALKVFKVYLECKVIKVPLDYKVQLARLVHKDYKAYQE